MTSGVDKLYCRLLNSPDFVECDAAVALNALNEGTQSLTAYAMDRAGNLSPPAEYSWIVDLTPPTTRIIDPIPPTLSISNMEMIHFEGDDSTGSGVDHFKCYLNDTLLADCASPAQLQNLADGNYSFLVQSVDKVGWESLPAQLTSW